MSNKDKRTLEKLDRRVADLEEERKRETATGGTKPKDERLAFERYADKIKPFHFQLDDMSSSPDSTDLIVNSFSLSIKGKKLFESASLKIVAKQRYGFLGPNGRGKSTLLLHLAAGCFPLPNTWDCVLVEQEVDASDEITVVDEVLRADKDLKLWTAEEEGLVQKLEKDASEASSSGDRFSIEEVTVMVERLQELGELLSEKQNAEAEVRRILAGLGFSDKGMDTPTSHFSGGWRMRISLAKSLFMKPKLLLLDEPTNHLDLEATLWLEDYLSAYPHTLIAVSHDADFLDAVCTDTMALEETDEGGKLTYCKGAYSNYKHMADERRKKQLKEFQKSGKQKALKPPPEYVVTFKFEKIGADERRLQGIGVQSVSFRYPPREAWSNGNGGANPISASASPQAKKSPSCQMLFSEVNMRFDTDSRVALVGPNGCGKSTLLRLLLKKLEPVEGEVEQSKGLRIGFFSQHFEELLPLDRLMPGGKPFTSTDFLMNEFDLNEEKARAQLGRFGLPSKAHHISLESLSGGQKARVCFAKICLSKPHMLVFDEPTNHLDIESVEALVEAIAEYDGGIILVSHDARLVQALGQTVFLVGDGGLQEVQYEKYVRKVLTDVAERAERAKERAMAKARERKEKRDSVLKKAKK